MAATVIARTETASSIANRHDLTRRTVFRYMRKLKNRLAMKDYRGRPKVFDEVSKAVLRAFFDTPVPLPWDEVKQVLVEQQRKTWCRLHHTSINSISGEFGPKKMSPRTVRRYLKEFNYVRE